MNCNCISDIEKNCSENGYSNFKIANAGFIFKPGEVTTTLNIPATYQEMKKDGNLKAKKSTVNLLAKYCPFCGKTTENADKGGLNEIDN